LGNASVGTNANGQSVLNPRTTPGLILLGGAAPIALQIDDSVLLGSIFNGGIILSTVNDAINIDASIINGGLTNTGSITAPALSRDGIAISDTTFSGGIHNQLDAEISADDNAILISGNSILTGGLTNAGLIETTNGGNAIRISSGVDFSGSITNTANGGIWGGAGDDAISISADSFAGGISNSGQVQGQGANGNAIDIDAGVFTGGIRNTPAGDILVNGAGGVAVRVAGGSFAGGIVNNGTIGAVVAGVPEALHALQIGGNVFAGGISNTGTIESDGNTTILISSGQFAGGIINAGLISALEGNAIVVSGTSFGGGIFNQGTASSISATGDAIFIGNTTAFAGGITNAGTVRSSASNNAIDIDAISFSGGITNSGSITADDGPGAKEAAILFSGNSFAGGITNTGLIRGGEVVGAIEVSGGSFAGGIINSGAITGEGALGIATTGTTFTGGINNQSGGRIGATVTAISVASSSFAGGITNAGTIGDALIANTAIDVSALTFSGGILNSGTIQGANLAIDLNGTNFSGGITNQGRVESTAGAATTILVDVDDFDGGITNSGVIVGDVLALSVTGANFEGGINNQTGGRIESTDNGTALAISSGSFTGGITNAGSIIGEDIAINLSGASFGGGILNQRLIRSDGAAAAALEITVTSFSGGISNTGTIQSGDGLVIGNSAAISIDNTSFTDGIVNEGLVQGGALSGTGAYINATTFTGGIRNTGTVQGADDGLFIDSANFAGGLDNNGGTIRSTVLGYGVHINSNTFSGGVTNSGSIKGLLQTGLFVEATTFTGGVNNSGTISGDSPGVVIDAINFSGNFVNARSGLIEGTGVGGDGARLFGTNFNGNFSNTGSITGSVDGVDIDYDNFTGDFTNAFYGEITGDRGAVIRGTNFYGDILNAGLIDGGEGEGLRLEMSLLAGGVTNSGDIEAEDDALKVNGTTTITGDVLNTKTGSIVSDFSDAVDINGTIEGKFSNAGFIEGGGGEGGSGNGIDLDGVVEGGIFNSGTIRSENQGAVDLTDAGADTELTQTAGLISDGGEGALSYAINMNNLHNDIFYANGGVVEGDIEGGPASGDDMITQTGTFAWAFGTTGGTRLDEFDINSGGTSVLGAYQRGDTGGVGVTVLATTMDVAGNVYLDNNTTVTMSGAFDADPTAQVEFFLTANPAVHGQINANTINLDGDIAVYLDTVSFASAPPILAGTPIFYDNVLTSTNRFGTEFDNSASITTSSIFFEGEAVYDGNQDVDINLTRLALDEALEAAGATESQNQNEVASALEEIYLDGTYGIQFQDLLEDLFAGDLTPEEVQDIFDNLGGAEHAQLQASTLGLSTILNTFMSDRLDSTLPGLAGGKSMAGFGLRDYADGSTGTTATDASPPASAGNRGLNSGASGASIWARGFGNWTTADGDVEATGYEQDSGGAAVGVDFAVNPNITVGAAGSWSSTDVSFDTLGDNAEIDTWQGGLYGSYGIGKSYVDATASYASHDVSAERLIDLPADDFIATSSYNATAWSVTGELGHIWRVGRVDVQPSVGLAYTSVSTDAFNETSASNAFDLRVQGSDASSFASTLAVRASGQFLVGRTRVMPDLKLGWRHDFGDDRQAFTAAFEEDPVTFEIVSSKTQVDAAVVNAGVTAAVSKSVEVFVDLNGLYGGEVATSNASGGLRFTW
jgi:uncharacterized protein with beta-barrel porin domain